MEENVREKIEAQPGLTHPPILDLVDVGLDVSFGSSALGLDGKMDSFAVAETSKMPAERLKTEDGVTTPGM